MRLGARLAWGTPGQRGRSLLVALAAGLGTLVLLAVLAVTAAERVRSTGEYSDVELRRLTTAIVLAVALPVIALAATVARLSAALRDRRLANLRLLGLTSLQTRVVAATEAGLAAVVGTALGGAAFVLVRPVLAAVDLAGREWDTAALRPGPVGWLLAVVGVPLVITAVASLPHRLGAGRALERARRADLRRPSVLRIAPLAVGLGLCAWSFRLDNDHNTSSFDITVLMAAIAITGLGLLIVVPVFVRLLADGLLRASRGPVGLVTARRLQAQPAGVTRVISALMIGLFLVVGARGVVVAWETTPQYLSAADDIEVGQRGELTTTARKLDRTMDRLARVEGVRDAVVLPVLSGWEGASARRPHGEAGQMQVTAAVASCADFERFATQVTNCVDGEPMLLTSWWMSGDVERVTLSARAGGERIHDQSVTLDVPTKQMAGPAGDQESQLWIRPLYADLLLPPDTPGISPMLADTDRTVIVLGGPGRDLDQQLSEVGLFSSEATDVATYEFVGGLRTIVWTLAAVILGVGLLTFAIAGIDRALARRREVVSLQVIGTPPSVLRRAQWLEAVLPTALGCLLAITCGLLAGATYLQLDGEESAIPVSQSITLAGIALLASVAIAGITVVATNTRISPDQLRRE